MEEIIKLDKELFLFINTLGSSNWDGFWLFLSERFYWIPLYIVLFGLIIYKLGIRKACVILGLCLLMILFTDQITNLFKSGFQRLRPCHDPKLQGLMRRVTCSGRYGFTSAHASNHFGFALFLGLIFRNKIKWLLPALLVWAGFISYSRIYLGVHFPLDIICGATLGLVFAYLNYKIYQKIIGKYSNFFQ